jgi:hypothetical protein
MEAQSIPQHLRSGNCPESIQEDEITLNLCWLLEELANFRGVYVQHRRFFLWGSESVIHFSSIHIGLTPELAEIRVSVEILLFGPGPVETVLTCRLGRELSDSTHHASRSVSLVPGRGVPASLVIAKPTPQQVAVLDTNLDQFHLSLVAHRLSLDSDLPV